MVTGCPICWGFVKGERGKTAMRIERWITLGKKQELRRNLKKKLEELHVKCSIKVAPE